MIQRVRILKPLFKILTGIVCFSIIAPHAVALAAVSPSLQKQIKIRPTTLQYVQFGKFQGRLSQLVEEESQTSGLKQDEADKVRSLTEKAFNLSKLVGSKSSGINYEIHKSALRDTLTERKRILEDILIQSPSFFLQLALSPTSRSNFPSEFQDYIEKKISLSGELQIVHADTIDGKTSQIRYFVLEKDNTKRTLIPVGVFPQILSGSTITAYGYGFGDLVAVPVETKEYFSITKTVPLGPITAPQKTVALLIRFQDNPNQDPPFSLQEGQRVVFAGPANQFFKESSYGKAFLDGTAYGWFTLPLDCKWFPEHLSIADVMPYVDPFIDFSGVERIYSIIDTENLSGRCGGDVAGFSTVGKISLLTGEGVIQASVSWGRANHTYIPVSRVPGGRDFPLVWGDLLVMHEVGHGFGIGHEANLYECGTRSVDGTCTISPYGDQFDAMGGRPPGAFHYNAYSKQRIGWISSSNITTVNSSGRYAVKNLESPGATALFIRNTPAVRQYYVEYRIPIGFDQDLRNDYTRASGGVLLIHGVYGTPGSASNWSILIDAHPANDPEEWKDGLVAGLLPGETFVDSEAGISITNDFQKIVEEPDKNSLSPILVAPLSAAVSVHITPPICTRAQPLLTLEQPKFFLPVGTPLVVGRVDFAEAISNRDSQGCSPSLFSSIINAPSGWTSRGNFPLSLAPNFAQITGYGIGNPTSTMPGSELFTQLVTNTNSGIHTSASIESVVVRNIKPALTVQLLGSQARMTAQISTGSLSGSTSRYSLYFYCNRSDDGIDITPDYEYFTSTADASVTTPPICNYGRGGVYTAKVIVAMSYGTAFGSSQIGYIYGESRAPVNIKITKEELSASMFPIFLQLEEVLKSLRLSISK